jgi:hypothetical protein
MENIEESLEITKLFKENAHVYKLPPLSISSGYTYDDFQDLIFKGNMKITTKDNLCIIYFINENSQTPYLISIVESDFEKTVNQATGSSRYFTLKAMTLDKKEGIYGLAFKQRNDAFDFWNTLVEFKEKSEFERKLIENKDKEYKPKYEFSSLESKEKKIVNKGFSNFKFTSLK